MPATVIANTELAQGGIVLTQHNFSATADGGFTYTPVYVSLSQFDRLHTPKFRKNHVPPLPLPEAMSYLGLGTPLQMTDVSVERGNGLTYWSPIYVGALREVFEETEQEVQKTFSKSVTIPVRFTNRPTIERTYTLSFDYMSMTVTTSSKFNYIVRRGANSLVSQPFNISGDFSRVSFRPDRILTRNRTKAASGQTTYSASVTGIYV